MDNAFEVGPMAQQSRRDESYDAPALVELGPVQELTLVCDKRLNGSDGFTFMGIPIVCRS